MLDKSVEIYEIDMAGKVNQGQKVDVIFLNFKKAFDILPRTRLMIKLEAHGNPICFKGDC